MLREGISRWRAALALALSLVVFGGLATGCGIGPSGSHGSHGESHGSHGESLRGVSEVVVTGDGPGSVRRAWQGAAQRAMALVRGAWGEPELGRVVVQVPSSDVQARTDSPSDVERGAVAVVDFRPEGAVVTVNPRLRLTSSGYAQVLAHELAHVLMRRWGTAGTGTWLSEGLAMWTQYYGADPRQHADTAALRAAARADQLPHRFPPTGSFTGAEASRLAYQQAWTIVLFLVQQRDAATLRSLWGDVAGGKDLETSLQQRYSMTEQEVMTAWRHWVKSW